jgi:hypothetical protein
LKLLKQKVCGQRWNEQLRDYQYSPDIGRVIKDTKMTMETDTIATEVKNTEDFGLRKSGRKFTL